MYELLISFRSLSPSRCEEEVEGRDQAVEIPLPAVLGRVPLLAASGGRTSPVACPGAGVDGTLLRHALPSRQAPACP